MRTLYEYLGTKVVQSKIKAKNETIRNIVKDEFDRLGHDCDLNHIDTSEVTNMYFLFCCVESPTALGLEYKDINPDISKWNVSNVNNMDSMFKFCKKFNCDISDWDVSKVNNMYNMFYGCESFNQDIGNWQVDNVEVTRDMFYECISFNQDLSKWNMPKAGPIYEFDMFYDCPIQHKKELLPNIKFRE